MEKKQQVREQSEQQPVLSDKRSNQPCVLLLKVANAYTWDPPSEQSGMILLSFLMLSHISAWTSKLGLGGIR